MISKAALKSSLCCDVNIVRGRLQLLLALRWSFSCPVGLVALIVDTLSYSSLLNTSTKKIHNFSMTGFIENLNLGRIETSLKLSHSSFSDK